MNREIKFRAYVPTLKKFLILNLTNDDAEVWFEGEEGDHKVIGAELPKHEGWKQFTNLKDKNGKEIYEGDIVRSFYANNNVMRKAGRIDWRSCSFWVEWDNGEADAMNYHHLEKYERNRIDYWEVIGNVWENPELLNQ